MTAMKNWLRQGDLSQPMQIAVLCTVLIFIAAIVLGLFWKVG